VELYTWTERNVSETPMRRRWKTPCATIVHAWWLRKIVVMSELASIRLGWGRRMGV